MATTADPMLIGKFVDNSARPIFNYRRGKARAELPHTTKEVRKAGQTSMERAEQELHEAIMDYAMTYAITHSVEVT